MTNPAKGQRYYYTVQGSNDSSSYGYVSIENSLQSIVLGADFHYAYVPLLEKLGYGKVRPEDHDQEWKEH